MNGHARALLAEAAGTFWFFFIGAGAIIADANGSGGGLGAIAAAHGITLAVAVSAFGPLSGAHFNPATTLGLAIAGRHPWSRVPTYWIAQLVGGLAAGFALRGVFDFALAAIDKTHLGTPALANGVSVPVGIGVTVLEKVIRKIAVRTKEYRAARKARPKTKPRATAAKRAARPSAGRSRAATPRSRR